MAHLNGPAIKNEILDELMKSVKNPDDLLGEGGLLRQLTARLVEKALQAELTSHLGYDAGQARPEGASNGRNGYTSKTLFTDQGEVTVDVPRDREGSFEPQLVRTRERRLTGFDDRILALYARGMSVRDIKGHLQEMYGVEVSPDLISRVTDAVMEDVAASCRSWTSRRKSVASSTRPTPSSPSTRACGSWSSTAATSPRTRPRSSSCSWACATSRSAGTAPLASGTRPSVNSPSSSKDACRPPEPSTRNRLLMVRQVTQKI